jgi:hypothetical protein
MVANNLNVLLENIIEESGGLGRFQIFMLTAVSCGKLALAWSMLMMSFGGALPDWWCIDGEADFNMTSFNDVTSMNDSTSYKTCFVANTSRTCSGYIYSDSMRTVATEVRHRNNLYY